MVRRQMKNYFHALHCRARHPRFAQIRLQKINFASAQMLANVAEVTAAQIIDEANFGSSAREKLIRERRADERSEQTSNCANAPRNRHL